jgi:hypothetical protein
LLEIKDEVIEDIDCDDVEKDVVYTSEILEGLTPTFKKISKKLRDICFSDKKALLRFVLKNKDNDELKEDRWYGFFTSSIDIIEKDYDRDFYLYDREGQKTENFINFNVFNILKL